MPDDRLVSPSPQLLDATLASFHVRQAMLGPADTVHARQCPVRRGAALGHGAVDTPAPANGMAAPSRLAWSGKDHATAFEPIPNFSPSSLLKCEARVGA